MGSRPSATNSSEHGLDITQLRGEFPILSQRVHGKPLVYLDNAATTQKPKCVIDAVDRFYTEYCSNVHRGLHQLSTRATEAYEGARDKVAKFIGARDRREVIFTRGTTEAVNLVARTFGETQIGADDEILLTEMEHHSNIIPWQLLAERVGAKIRVLPIDDRGELVLDALDELLTPRTRLLGAVYISNALGTRNPVEELVRRAHANGTRVLLDGAQATAHERVDVAKIDCDFLALSGHKMFGATGGGALYGKAEILESLPPFLGGGEMIHSVTMERSTFKEPPYRFEAGTPDIAGAIGLGAAVDFIERIGIERMQEAEARLLRYATEQLSQIPQVQLIGTAANKASIVSFVVDGVHPHDVGTVLDLEGVAVRAGHHCTQPVMAHFGQPATVRASLAMYNTTEEIDALVAGLHKTIEVFR